MKSLQRAPPDGAKKIICFDYIRKEIKVYEKEIV